MDDIIKDGGPAYPGSIRNSAKRLTRNQGMSLRDWFAGQALSGMAANCDDTGVNGWHGDEKLAADYAYRFADAMLAARKGGA